MTQKRAESKLDWGVVREVSLAVAKRRGFGSDEAEDIASEVVLALLKQAPTHVKDTRAYARVAADHQCGRAIEEARRRRAREVRGVLNRLMVPAAVPVLDGPGARAQVAEALGAITEILLSLDERDRVILALLSMGLRSPQIGAVVGAPSELVRKRIQRVRDRMPGDELRLRLRQITEALPELSPSERQAALAAVGFPCTQVATLLAQNVTLPYVA